MKYLSLKVLILCILLPPILYIISVQWLEGYLKEKYTRKVEEIYIGDAHRLLGGEISLQDAIEENISRFLKKDPLVPLGLKIHITVSTKKRTLLYPRISEGHPGTPQRDPIKIASENYRLMKEGMVLRLELKLGHNTPITNGLLGFYILLSLGALFIYYKKAQSRAEKESIEKDNKISRLQERLKGLEHGREQLISKTREIRSRLKETREQAAKNEEDMLHEVINLEEKLQENLAQQEIQQQEIQELKKEIMELEEDRSVHKEIHKRKLKASFDLTQKRFKVLYKNIVIDERAVTGFTELNDDMKIKCEEIIHQLDQDPRLVPIKRKVFDGKTKNKILEIIFAYRGRLYYRWSKENRLEVLAIGTKNTQARELEYLSRL